MLLEHYILPEEIAVGSLKEPARIIGNTSRNHICREFAEELRRKASETVGLPGSNGIFAFKFRENVKRLRSKMQEMKRIKEEIERRAAERKDVKLLDDLRKVSTVAAASIVS